MTALTTRLAQLAAELARRNGRRFTDAYAVELTDAAIIIHLRTPPVVVVDPQPTPPGKPINRMEKQP